MHTHAYIHTHTLGHHAPPRVLLGLPACYSQLDQWLLRQVALQHICTYTAASFCCCGPRVASMDRRHSHALALLHTQCRAVARAHAWLIVSAAGHTCTRHTTCHSACVRVVLNSVNTCRLRLVCCWLSWPANSISTISCPAGMPCQAWHCERLSRWWFCISPTLVRDVDCCCNAWV